MSELSNKELVEEKVRNLFGAVAMWFPEHFEDALDAAREIILSWERKRWNERFEERERVNSPWEEGQ